MTVPRRYAVVLPAFLAGLLALDTQVSHHGQLALVRGESLVYWLKKLVFRGAWLDHRVKEGLLEVDWDDENKDFTYADTNGGRALLELLPTPSWHELQYRP